MYNGDWVEQCRSHSNIRFLPYFFNPSILFNPASPVSHGNCKDKDMMVEFLLECIPSPPSEVYHCVFYPCVTPNTDLADGKGKHDSHLFSIRDNLSSPTLGKIIIFDHLHVLLPSAPLPHFYLTFLHNILQSGGGIFT